MDADTQGVSGSPDIANTILQKIDKADAIVADMTLVDPDLKRRTPNPNVLFETGYAFKSLGFNRILMVFNDAYGETKDLPFDLGLKRVLTYTSPEEDPDRSTARGDLAKNLETKLRTMFGKAQG